MIPVDQRRAELKRAYRTQKNMAEELGISRMGAIRWQSGENVVVQVTIEVDGVAYPATVPVDLALRVHPRRMRNVKLTIGRLKDEGADQQEGETNGD